MPTLSDFAMEVPRRGNGFVFTASGSALWTERRIHVDFRAHLSEGGALLVSRLSLDARDQPDEVTATALREFPMGDLKMLVRQWVATGGRPNGFVAQSFRDRGEPVVGEAEWAEQRERAAALLAAPASRDGAKVGRPRTSDADLRSFAELYVKASRRGERAPLAVTAKAVGLTSGGANRRARAAREPERGWLAPVTRKGVRNEIAPGPRLFEAWEAGGYPTWWTENENEGENP